MGSINSKTVSASISGIDVTAFQNMEEAVSSVFTPKNQVIPGFALAMNAEKVMSARSNPMVKKVLKLATLRYADGIGVVLALHRKGIVSTKNTGCGLWEQIMVKAGKYDTRVFLVGAY